MVSQRVTRSCVPAIPAAWQRRRDYLLLARVAPGSYRRSRVLSCPSRSSFLATTHLHLDPSRRVISDQWSDPLSGQGCSI